MSVRPEQSDSPGKEKGRAKSMHGTDSKESLVLSGKRAAPKGKFRLIGVDTFEGPFADFLVGDFNSKAEAIAEASKRAGAMKPMYVYDENGNNIFSAGSP